MTESIFSLPAPCADVRLRYGDGPHDIADLRLPPALPPSPDPADPPPLLPVVVFVHGGFWRAQYDLEHAGHAAAALTAAGFATYSLEYRRVGQPGGGWPGTFLDVARAVDHLAAVAQDYPLDLTRVVAVGHSAGGHLALWLAGRHRVPAGSAVFTPVGVAIRGAVSLGGVVDLRHAYALGTGGDAVIGLMGGVPREASDRYDAGSPFELLPLGVSQILVHGAADAIVPLVLSERYAARARAAGDACVLRALTGTGHFELIDPRSDAWPHVVESVSRLATASSNQG